ncbi:MAG: DUF885 family protein [Gemmatimonadetes bacterium]|nr:DUF885 family protein [Gemmatimonadota bacterium]
MPDLNELLDSWQDLRWTFDPAVATRAGAQQHDGRLPGLDQESVKLQLAGLKSLASAVELADLADDGEEIDRTALLDELRAAIYRLEQEAPQRRNPAAWLGALAGALQALRAHANGTPTQRAQGALDRLTGAEQMIERAGKTLKRPAAVFVEEALELAPAVRGVARQLAAEGATWLPAMGERLREAAERAELAIAAFESKLREDVAASEDPEAFAIGREAFDHRLHFEHALRPSSPELWRWSQHTLDESRRTAVAAAVAAGLGDDLHAAAKKLRAARPVGDLQAEILRGLARALNELLVEVLLELCPGRLTHRSIARALPDPVRRALATPCATDGWALYGLDIALEQGFTADPQELFAIRLAQLHAAARAVIDIGLHTEGFTPKAATDLLTQLLPIDRADALADVRRAAAWPTYSLAAAVGRREIMELREAWRSGGRAVGRSFHDALLSYGGLPISLARWGMDLGLEE